MGLAIDQTMPLWLLIPAIGLILYGYFRHLEGSSRKKVFLILRLIGIICLILALSGPSLIRYAKNATTIFVSDLSSSNIGGREAMETFIKESIQTKSETDSVGIIAFGQDAGVELSVNPLPYFDKYQTAINPHFTNIQKALIQSNAMFPANSLRRLVLLTDGRENVGDVAKQIGSLIQNDIAIDVYDMASYQYAEVQIDSIELPSQGEKNQIIDITTIIKSNVKQKATLYIYSDNQLKDELEVELEVGDNNYIFNDVVTGGGLVPYRVEVVAESDTFSQNNQLSSYIMISDMPNILVIEDGEKQGQNIVSMLEGYGHIDVKNALEVPQGRAALLEYDAFVIADISKDDLDDTFIENLDEVIKNQGKGLLVIGGDNSYGLGGYKDTLLEEMLPVEMDVKSKEEKPNLGLILVIDKSGSMTGGQYGVSKLELAKEAAIRATEILEEKDMLGVIAFDDRTKWVIETSFVEDQGAMQDQIATIVPGGGTSILPSLADAVDNLIKQDVALKHIILLTDGQAERNGYDSTLALMRLEGITLSTVAVGEGADRALLYYLAENGGGRYYATDVFTDIPSIFTKEAYMAGKKYLNTVTFYPEVYSYSKILNGIEGLPELDGYVATTKKDSAKMVLVGPEEDPILAMWQYGLGRTMAWTADMQGLWSMKWLNWSGNQSFWMNSMSWLIQEGLDDDYSIASTYEDGLGKIRITQVVPDATMTEDMNGMLIAPDGTSTDIMIEATAPGTYEGSFVPEGEGVYLINIPLDEENVLATGVNVGYSPEFDILGSGITTPEALAKISGGRLLSNPADVFKGDLPPIKGSYKLTNLLLLIALLIFVFEIVLRKTNLNFEWVMKLTESVKELSQDVRSRELIQSFSKSEKAALKVEVKSLNKAEETKQEEASKGKSKKRRQEAETAHIDALILQKNKRKG